MAIISIYDVNDITIIDESTNAAPASNPLTAHESGGAWQWNMVWPYAGFEITLGTATVDIEFDDSDGVLSDDPFSGSTVIDQQLTSDVTIAGETFTANSETTLWQNPAPVFVQNEYEITVFDSAGTEYTMVAVSIGEGYDTTIVGVTFDGVAPPAGTTLHYDYVESTTTDNTSSSIPVAPCFAKGTLIDTQNGPIKVEDLCAGDLIKTLSNGFQKVIWIGSKSLELTQHTEHLRPVVIKKNSIGANIPNQDVSVSPAHRILLRSPSVQKWFGANEVLVSAKHLVDGTHITIDTSATSVEYFHVLFEQHEIIVTSNLESESFHPGEIGLHGFDRATREEVFELFPELRTLGLSAYGTTARKVLKMHEAKILQTETGHAA